MLAGDKFQLLSLVSDNRRFCLLKFCFPAVLLCRAIQALPCSIYQCSKAKLTLPMSETFTTRRKKQKVPLNFVSDSYLWMAGSYNQSYHP